MNVYENIVIINASLPDEEIDSAIAKIKEVVAGQGGQIVKTSIWGKRKLAYPLKHSLEGNYVLSKFELDPALSRELENNLQISDQILRHLLVKVGE